MVTNVFAENVQVAKIEMYLSEDAKSVGFRFFSEFGRVLLSHVWFDITVRTQMKVIQLSENERVVGFRATMINGLEDVRLLGFQSLEFIVCKKVQITA